MLSFFKDEGFRHIKYTLLGCTLIGIFGSIIDNISRQYYYQKFEYIKKQNNDPRFQNVFRITKTNLEAASVFKRQADYETSKLILEGTAEIIKELHNDYPFSIGDKVKSLDSLLDEIKRDSVNIFIEVKNKYFDTGVRI